MTTKTPPQLGRPAGASGEETRKRIIVATMKCVAEVGYSQATIREIARTANVTSASLYNYFPNKSELMRATIEARGDIAMPRLRAAAQGPGDIVDRIEAVLDECGHLIREYPDLAAFEWAIRAENVLPSGAPDVAGHSDPEVGAGFAAFREIIEVLVDDGCQRGELGAHPDPRGTVEAVYALIFGLTELAATLATEDFSAALGSAKVMVRGALFGGERPEPS
jgi:AcrR family transcriptional regulator